MKRVFAGLLAACLGGTASAGMLDFSQAGLGPLSNEIVIDGATVRADDPDVVIDVFELGGVEFDGFCFLGSDPVNCEHDGELIFERAVSGLNFFAVAWNPGDDVMISAFDDFGMMLGAAVIDDEDDTFAGGTAAIDFTALGPISRLVFDDRSNGQGFGLGYAGFFFDPVPVPGAIPLMATGLAAIGATFRRRRRA